MTKRNLAQEIHAGHMQPFRIKKKSQI